MTKPDELTLAIDKKRIRHWRNDIRDVLNCVWDPIGDCPEDEYDRYTDKIAAMIHHNATDNDLLMYLERSEVAQMGLGHPFDYERGERVVAALRQLGGPPPHTSLRSK